MMLVPFDDCEISGSAPRRPTSVIRASCDGRVEQKVRFVRLAGNKPALRHIDEVRKDILNFAEGLAGNKVRKLEDFTQDVRDDI